MAGQCRVHVPLIKEPALSLSNGGNEGVVIKMSHAGMYTIYDTVCRCHKNTGRISCLPRFTVSVEIG